ncbi:hypothetical protein BHE74_00057773 [Ensete ventricosum]|nr:hypothetical protein BHE74_00057773 [Ensete ventricosum]
MEWITYRKTNCGHDVTWLTFWFDIAITWTLTLPCDIGSALWTSKPLWKL